MVHFSILRSNLTALFVIAISGITLTVSIRVIFPELPGSYTGHVLLHMGGLTLATFITVLAMLAYRMMHSRRLLLTMIAFINFMFLETLLLISAIDSGIVGLEGLHGWEMGHLLMFITLGLLTLGLLRND